jgi:hypothetical protein
MKIITLENLNELNVLNNYNSCVVYGKGPTFRNDIIKKDKELKCAINHATNFLEEVDFLCCNDLKALTDIKLEKYKNIKFLLIPEYLHINNVFSINGYWEKCLYNHIKDYFNGYYIIYNLKTNPNPNKNLITLESALTSTNNLIEFISKYTNIKHIETYGFGVVSNEKYNKKFADNLATEYNENRINKIRANVIKNCNENNINLIIN